jgi:hypothetical protein
MMLPSTKWTELGAWENRHDTKVFVSVCTQDIVDYLKEQKLFAPKSDIMDAIDEVWDDNDMSELYEEIYDSIVKKLSGKVQKV